MEVLLDSDWKGREEREQLGTEKHLVNGIRLPPLTSHSVPLVYEEDFSSKQRKRMKIWKIKETASTLSKWKSKQ